MSKHQHWMGAACLALGVTAWIGCSSDSVTFDDDDGGSSSSSSSSSSGTGTPASYVGAAGVVIDEVAIYQGPKRLLAAGGIVAEPEVPLVAGRDALLRVFYTATPEAAGTAAVLRLEIGEEVIDTEITLAEASDEAQLGSTANVSIPGALIGQTLSYRVSILQDGSSDNPGACYPG